MRLRPPIALRPGRPPGQRPGPTPRARRPARRRATRLGALAVVLAMATPAFAGGFLDNSKPSEPTKPSWAVPAKRMPVEGEGTAALEAQLENARMRVQEAEQNASTAEYNLTRARTRRYPRGEALQEIRDRVAEMNKERGDAERDFLALVREARAGGVPTGVLMPYLDLADEIEAKQAARADP